MLYARYLIEVVGEAETGLDIFHVNGGLAALAVMRNGYVPDVIVSDVRMPRMSGYDLLTSVRGDTRFSSIPFILLSTVQDDAGESSANGALADGKMIKPSNYQEVLGLVDRIKSLCRGTEDRHDVGYGTTVVDSD